MKTYFELPALSGQLQGFVQGLHNNRGIALHFMSDDFFFTDVFPRATFQIKRAEPIKDATLSEPNFKVKGVFGLRGIKRDIEFPATVSPEVEGIVRVEAHFDIDRTRWGVIYGSLRFFEHLGMHLVFDLLSIELRILLRNGS